jgi:hypothetical protein
MLYCNIVFEHEFTTENLRSIKTNCTNQSDAFKFPEINNIQSRIISVQSLSSNKQLNFSSTLF